MTTAQRDRRALRLTRLDELMAATGGSEKVAVAVVDGPGDLTHPDLSAARVSVLPDGRTRGCDVPGSAACRHGTFVLGMLCSPRGTPAPGICPDCTFLLRPVLCEAPPGRTCPETTPTALAEAVHDCLDAGARIINLSLGITAPVLEPSPAFDAAVDRARAAGALVVAAAGNHGLVGPAPLMAHPWLVPVAACDVDGRLLRSSNIGIGVGRGGLLAPGAGIVSTVPGGYAATTGTSVAAPFVTGAAALLWSLDPRVPAARIRAALLRSGVPRRSVVPPLLDAAAARHALGLR